MGVKGSSSKRKSSKRKSSKRKRGKSSSEKKSQRKESRKHRRVHDSSYSDDDSLNSEHSSSSTSKSHHKKRTNKRKKPRQDYSVSSHSDDQSVSSDSDSLSTYDNKPRKLKRSKVALNSTKKRARKRSPSPSSDSDTHSVRKRKRVDRNRVVKPIKKSSKKKPKRYLSSSSSSDTENGSKVIIDKEIERHRGRESYKARKKHRVRSPSRSSYGRGDDGDSVSVSHSDEVVAPVNNSRRLRSVISVVYNKPHDEGENRWEDACKEEIVYDRNDYPSPKSLDSNEEGNKMEPDDLSLAVDVKEVSEVGKSGVNEGDQDRDSDHHLEGAHLNNLEKEKDIEAPVPVSALGGDVLESVLRQKALENLKKFKGRIQLKKDNERDVNKSSMGRVDIVQNKSTKQGSSSPRELKVSSGPSLIRGFSQLREAENLTDREHIEKEHSIAKKSLDDTPNELGSLGCLEEGKTVISHSVLAKSVSSSDNGQGVEAINSGTLSTAEPSSVGPLNVEHSLERENEAKDGSQYEQKTMSVMRGGEGRWYRLAIRFTSQKRPLPWRGGN